MIYNVQIVSAENEGPDPILGFQWSTEPPTVPGWYWVMTDGVTDQVYVSQTGQVYCALAFESSKPIDTIKEFISHWLGPLPVPEPLEA